MTVPYGATQPQRMPNGYVQMPGGYDPSAGQGGQQGGQPQFQPQQMQQVQQAPQQYLTQLGQPAAVHQVGPIMQDAGWNPPPQMQQGGALGPQQGRGDINQLRQFQQVQQGIQPAGLDLNARLSGPGVPAELQGRTVAEALAIHNGMRQVHLQLMQSQQQQGGGQQTQVPERTAPVNGQPAAGEFDWRKPKESIAGIVEEKLNGLEQRLQGILAPIAQNNAVSSLQSARQSAAAQIGPSFAQLEPLILQKLQGIDPRALTNPQTWVIAADATIGELTRRGVNVGAGQGQQPQYSQQNGGPGMYPAQQVQQGQSPLPSLNSFFSEQPNMGGPGAQGVQLTQQQRAAASAMRMTEADYSAWSGGVQNNAGMGGWR